MAAGEAAAVISLPQLDLEPPVPTGQVQGASSSREVEPGVAVIKSE